MDVATSTAIRIAEQTRSVSYSEVASVTLLTWDVLITLSDEVELVWKQRWTAAKVLYLLARYLPLGFQLALLAINIDGTTGLQFTVDQCKIWMIFQAIVLQLVITTVDIVLMIRVFALYNKSKPLLLVLSIAFVGEVAYLSYNLATVTPKLGFTEDCFVRSSPPSFIIYWIVSLAFETLLFLLTLIKFFIAVKDGWGKRPVMKEFVRDGTWAFALIFVTMAINSALYKSVHSPLAGICFTWLLSVLSFAGSRLILNPRRRTNQAVSTEAHSGDGGVAIPLSPLSFRPTSTISPISPYTPNTPIGYSKQSFGGKSNPSSPMERYKSRPWDEYPPPRLPRDTLPVQIRVEVRHEHEMLPGIDSPIRTPREEDMDFAV